MKNRVITALLVGAMVLSSAVTVFAGETEAATEAAAATAERNGKRPLKKRSTDLYDHCIKKRRPDPGPSSGKSRRERGDHARSSSF